MNDTNLEIIRAKCIEANPEKKWEEAKPSINGVIYLAKIPCRLADVLLTRVKSFKESSRDYDLAPIVKDSPEDKQINAAVIEVVRKWNLRKDSLEEQSKETLQFIADLLK